MQGIYLIKNTITGQVYVGSSSNIKHRHSVHKTCLRGNYHDNKYLQNSWNKYGEENFVFLIIEECDCDNLSLIQKEETYIKYYKSYIRKFGYNLGRCAISPMKGKKHSKRMKDELSKRFSGKGNPMYGSSMSKKTKSQISQSLKIYFCNNPPKPMSDDVKKKISEAQKGEKNHNFGKFGSENAKSKAVYKICKDTGKIIKKYGSLCLAAKDNHILQGNLSKVLSGVGKTLGGFKWEFVN